MRKSILQMMMLLVICFSMSACVGTMIGAATDVVVETAKVPFKVGGAVVDVVSGDDDDEGKD